MTMMNEQRKRHNQQTIQQIRDLARAGQWQEAKQLADTLPDSPDTTKMKERIEKQLFIATGEVPAVMEDSPVLVDAAMDAALLDGVPIATRKPKPVEDSIPAYMPIRVVAYLLYSIGMIAMMLGVCFFFYSFLVSYSLYVNPDSIRTTAFTSFISGLFTVAGGAMMLMFVDIAQNTFRTNRLLVQLLYKDGMEGERNV